MFDRYSPNGGLDADSWREFGDNRANGLTGANHERRRLSYDVGACSERRGSSSSNEDESESRRRVHLVGLIRFGYEKNRKMGVVTKGS